MQGWFLFLSFTTMMFIIISIMICITTGADFNGSAKTGMRGDGKSNLQVVEGLAHVPISCENNCLQALRYVGNL